MHSWLVRRATLVSELQLAHEESARLSEMIPVLQAAHVVEGVRLSELTFERRRAFHRALALHKALRKLDAEVRGGAAPAGAQRSAA
jgi:hypothetical protein